MADRQRICITLSEQTKAITEQLKTDTDADSISEVIRNAIRLAYSVSVANRAGAKVLIERADGSRMTLGMSPVVPIDPTDGA